MTKRFEARFAKLEAKHEGAFVPFVTLCDPDFDTSVEILKKLIECGADALELGFPFSDPCADGPVIQKADKRALNSGAKTKDFFRAIAELRKIDSEIPVSILVYSNVVLAHGVNNFYKMAKESGIDAVLVPDVPCNMLNTVEDFEKCAQNNDIDLVLIAPPNASDECIKDIAKRSKGYTYILSRFGITGTENTFGRPVRVIEGIAKNHGAPTLLGFGISTPEHVKEALKTGVKGAIAGSGCVKIVEENLGNKDKMLDEIGKYITAMKAATVL